MKPTVESDKNDAKERKALWRRVQRFYDRFNQSDWDGCFALIDPQLTTKGKVDLDSYSKLMQAFLQVYGHIKRWGRRLSLHLDAAVSQGDKRPFAYVYVIWQDHTHHFHMFRERWIKENGKWFTRIVGLVPNRDEIG